MVEWRRKAGLFPSTERTAVSTPTPIPSDLNLEVNGCWKNLTTLRLKEVERFIVFTHGSLSSGSYTNAGVHFNMHSPAFHAQQPCHVKVEIPFIPSGMFSYSIIFGSH